jgi:hypothetical protein
MPFKEIEIGEGRFGRPRGIKGVFIREIARLSPLRLVHLNPVSEETMADMRRIAWRQPCCWSRSQRTGRHGRRASAYRRQTLRPRPGGR